MKRRAVIEIQGSDSRPAVTIHRLSGGEITYTVRATGRDVKLAAKRAKEAFQDLAAFVEFVRDAGLKTSMAKTLAEMNHR